MLKPNNASCNLEETNRMQHNHKIDSVTLNRSDYDNFVKKADNLQALIDGDASVIRYVYMYGYAANTVAKDIDMPKYENDALTVTSAALKKTSIYLEEAEDEIERLKSRLQLAGSPWLLLFAGIGIGATIVGLVGTYC